MIRQPDFSSFAEGPRPHQDEVDDEGEVVPSPPYRGRRCARCGHPLGHGGFCATVGGLLCWSCFQDKGLGRRGPSWRRSLQRCERREKHGLQLEV